MNAKKPVIFCDFDGTITVSDNIVSIMKHFDPPGWQPIMRQTFERQISLRQGIGRMFALFPSSMKEDILAYVRELAVIRAGFQSLLDYCRERGIRFLVTSGGIDFFVHPILAPFQLAPEQIYCNGSRFDGERIEILWPHPCDEACDTDCGMCKTRVVRSYPPDRFYRIVIGDSLTDFEAAKLADLVYARSHLLERCREMGYPHVPYEDFHQVIDDLRRKGIQANG